MREWNYTTNLHKPGGMTDRELLAAAQFACDREVWDRCINASDRTRVDFDQRYPMPFREAVLRRSREVALDPAYVYGLIRQESRFIMDARSHVGASGLMQVMPATARWTAKRIGMNSFTIEQLNERETNIAIGTGSSSWCWTTSKAPCHWPPPPTTRGPGARATGATGR